MRLTFLLLLIPAFLSAQKPKTAPTGWLADTVSIYLRENPCFDFNPKNAGTLVQKDQRTWWLYSSEKEPGGMPQLPLYFFHSSPALFDDCVYFDLAANAANIQIDRFSDESWLRNSAAAASSLRFYMGHIPMQKSIYDELIPDSIPLAAIKPYYQPFYFKKCEVSNLEYREFVNWVRDSVAMRLLVENGFTDEYLQESGNVDENEKLAPLNWKMKVRYDETAPEYAFALQSIFQPVGERFYHRKSIDPKKLIYLFNSKPEGYALNQINIYPDTLCWVNDFSYSYNEPMSNMYFWHPAYNNYPVVGVNYWQCLAFLEWKSKMLSQQLKKKKLKATCALPSEREWDMASTAEKVNEQVVVFGPNYFSTCDNSWLTDLRLTIDSSQTVTIYEGPKDTASYQLPTGSTNNGGDQIYLKENSKKPYPVSFYHPDGITPYQGFVLQNERTKGDLISDGYFHTGPVNMELRSRKFDRKNHITHSKREKELAANERHQAHFDKQSGIYYLDGNVSEWMRDDLNEGWKSVYEKHQPVTQKGPMFEQFLAIHSAENYFYNQLPKNGKLVRGCNWYDERYSNKYEKNTAGMNAKTFLEPEKAHCTVGFRYVIYVEAVKE